MIREIEKTDNYSPVKKVRRFVFVYRAIFFILGLAGISIAGVLIIFNISNKSNIDFMTRSTIHNSATAYKDLQQNTVNMLSATLSALMSNEIISKLFYMRDAEHLYQYTRPIYEDLKIQNGITHWYFIDREPAQTCFLRVHDPTIRNDKNTRFTLQQSIRSHHLATGCELGKTALALRAVHPYYHQTQLIGYIELGVDIQHLFKLMKRQTGNEYGLLIHKKFISQQDWQSVTKTKNMRNNWRDLPHHLLITSTSTSSLTQLFQKNLAHLNQLDIIPDNGLVLDLISNNNTHFVSGLFPFYDSMNHKIGGVFILKDVSAIFNSLNQQKRKIVLLLLVFMGIITGLMIFFHKRAEIELRNYRRHLEVTVLESTAVLRETNRKLNLEIQEHKMAEHALQNECLAREAAEKSQISAIKQVEQSARLASIGVMAAGITHEINQPLNAIKVTADSIQYWHKRNPNALPEPFIDQLDLISKSVKRIVEIIQHMRSFWVVPETSTMASIDLNVVLDNALSLIRQQLHHHHIQEHVNRHHAPLLVAGNLIHFEQIVINIVVNAIHALNEKKQLPKILQLQTRMDTQTNCAVLVVQDNGPGLPTASLDKLFDPFFSTNNSGEGMGLGLAIVKRYVDRYNGTIQAANLTYLENDIEYISGAMFTLTFPLASADVNLNQEE